MCLILAYVILSRVIDCDCTTQWLSVLTITDYSFNYLKRDECCMIMTLIKQTIIRFIKDMSCYDLLKDIGPVMVY